MKTLLFLSLLFLIAPQQVQAYLDPGTGSFIIQILVGGGLGLFFVIKKYWSYFISLLSKKSKKTTNEKEANKKEYND